MNPINRSIARELKNHWGRYFAIFVLSALIIMINSSFFAVQRSIKSGYYQSHIEGKVEDGRFVFDKKPDEKIMALLSERYKEVQEAYFREIKQSKTDIVKLYPNREKINLPAFFEGRPAENENELAIERNYAKNNKLRLGQSFRVGDAEYKITGFFAVTDYSALMRNRGDLVMDSSHFCVALTTKEGVERPGDGVRSHTVFYQSRNESANDDEKYAEMKETLKALYKAGCLPADSILKKDNLAISYVIDDMGGDVPMMWTFFIIAMLVTAFLFAVISSITLEEEAPVIGALKATGYKNGELFRHYLTLPLAVTLSACLVGNILAYTLMYRVYLAMYTDFFSLFPYKWDVSVMGAVFTTAMPIAALVIVYSITIYPKLSLAPLRFLRGDIRRIKIRGALEHKRLGFLWRFRLRIIEVNAWLFAALFLGIVLANTLLVFGIAGKFMVNHHVDYIDKDILANYQTFLRMPVEHENGEEATVANVMKRQPKNNIEYKIQLFGFKPDSTHLGKKLPANEAIISRGLAEKFGTKIGDEFKVHNSVSGRDYYFYIAGYSEYCAGLALFVNQEDLNSRLGKADGYFNLLLTEEEPDIDKDMIASQQGREDALAIGRQLIEIMNDMTGILLIVAILIYLIVIYVLTETVIDRSKLSISYLKIFGYRNDEISSIYIKSSVAAIIAFMIVSQPLVNALVKFLYREMMKKMNGYIPINTTPLISLICIALGITVTLLVRIIHVRKIYKMDMSRALKENMG